MSVVRLQLNISTFHRQSQFGGEMTFFRIWRAAFRKWFFGFPAVFHSVHVEPEGSNQGDSGRRSQ